MVGKSKAGQQRQVAIDPATFPKPTYDGGRAQESVGRRQHAIDRHWQNNDKGAAIVLEVACRGSPCKAVPSEREDGL